MIIININEIKLNRKKMKKIYTHTQRKRITNDIQIFFGKKNIIVDQTENVTVKH